MSHEVSPNEDVALLVKVYGDGSLPEFDYEANRKEQIAAGLPTWLAERTPYGGLHIQYWSRKEHQATLVVSQEGALVMHPFNGNLISGYLPFAEAVALAEMEFEQSPFEEN
jgi:hypothetical protein